MSNLLSQASLVMIPSGYKEDVVYSQIPTDGSGDLSFTRASNGTRINSQGLVEVCPWNLLQYSEDFTNAFWNKATNGAATFKVTANQTTAPNGTNTADLISITRSATSELSCVYTLVGQGIGTFKNSIWLKAKDSSNVGKTIDLWSWEGDTRGYTKITLTADWVRYDQNTTVFTGSASELFDFGLLPISYSTSTTLAVEFYAWGAQSNIGSTAKPYFPTTDRLNVPRLTYQNGGGGCPSLLLEKQSTNICSQSRNFQTTWTNSNVTITANSTTDVYGTTEAQKIEATGSGVHRCAQFLSTTSGSVYALSIDAKKGSTDWVMIRHDNGGSLNYFNLNTGTKGATCDASALIENVGNGWYRLTVFHTTSSSSGPELYVAKGNNDHDFTANGEYIYIDNVQYEQSSYPTSRIITTSSSATRVADLAYKTSATALIGQTTGSVFVDFELFTLNGYEGVVEITGSQRLLIWRNGTSLILFTDFGAGYIDTTFAIGRHKACFTYTSSYIKFFVDGVKIGQIASTGLTGGFNKLDFENSQGGVEIQRKLINECVVSKSEFTESEAIALTTI